MRAELGAFPVVYFHIFCAQHNCHVSMAVKPNSPQAGQITTTGCQTGGSIEQATCVNDWKISISGAGFVTVKS